MLAAKQALILREVEEGTGAEISLEVDQSRVQAGLRLWFADLSRASSPIVTLRPTGLHRFEARMTFGHLAGHTIAQMQRAEPEAVQLARALITTVARTAEVSISGNQTLEDWVIVDGAFTITAEKRGIGGRFDEEALAETCRGLVIPILAAMAELYGYDPVVHPEILGGEMEGAVTVALVKRRERNPRNRLLCLRIHGALCGVCKIDLKAVYGEAGSAIEVHHLQPVSLLDSPRAYHPVEDLIPLCPNCHRAVHMRRPMPWTPEDLRRIMKLS